MEEDRENLMIERLESALRRLLNPEEKFEIEMWDRGRVLAQVVHTEAWVILLDTIKNYAETATEDLLRLSPGDDKIKEAHAVAFALNDFFIKFQQDVNQAIQASVQTPSALKEAARSRGWVPPESL